MLDTVFLRGKLVSICSNLSEFMYNLRKTQETKCDLAFNFLGFHLLVIVLWLSLFRVGKIIWNEIILG